MLPKSPIHHGNPLQSLVCPTSTPGHLVADVLPLPVAIQPEHEVTTAFGLRLEVLRHPELRIRLLLHGGSPEERQGVHAVPVVVLGWEVDGIHVARTAGDLEPGALAIEVALVPWKRDGKTDERA